MRLTERIKALTGGQAAVLVIVGLIATYMLWGKANAAEMAAAVAGPHYAEWKALRNEVTVFRYASLACAAVTAFLTFIWFGRRRND